MSAFVVAVETRRFGTEYVWLPQRHAVRMASAYASASARLLEFVPPTITVHEVA